MFFLDDSLFFVVDAYNEDVGTVETSVVVVHVKDTLLEAPRLDSADPQDQAIYFWDVASLRTYPMPDLQLYALLSVRKIRAFWRGESTTYVTLLMRPEVLAPRLYGPEYAPTSGVTVVKYKWESAASTSPGHGPDHIQERTLNIFREKKSGETNDRFRCKTSAISVTYRSREGVSRLCPWMRTCTLSLSPVRSKGRH